MIRKILVLISYIILKFMYIFFAENSLAALLYIIHSFNQIKNVLAYSEKDLRNLR